MGLFSDLVNRAWAAILDNKNKLTTTGGLLAGIILTLAFKDLYPDLEHSFRQRIRRLRGHHQIRPLPGQSDHVRLEDHTQRSSRRPLKDASNSANASEGTICVGIEGLIGNTPLIQLRSLSEATGCEILAKAEFLNGAGNSPKDRVALSIITTAEDEGLIAPGRGDTIYEGTVGSTGISLAAVCRARGYTAHMCVDAARRTTVDLADSTSTATCLMIKQKKSLHCCSSLVRQSNEYVRQASSTGINS